MSHNIILDPEFDKYICPVYLTDLEGDSQVLSCGHPFSSQFIKDIYKNSIKQCPICRDPIEHVSKNNYVLSEAIGENKALRRENDIIREENKGLKAKVTSLESILQNVNNSLDKISSQLAKMEGKVDTLTQKNDQLTLQIEEDRNKHKQICGTLKSEIIEGKEKYEALEKKFEADTLSLKTQIAEKNKPVYYSSDSDSDSDDDVPVKQIVVRPAPLSKAGEFIADILSCKHLTRILNGQRN